MADNNKHLTPASLDRFLTVQEKEIALREKELEHSTQSRAFAHEYALEALKAQTKDREGIRHHESNSAKVLYIFASGLIVGLFILFGFAIKFNKDQIVMEILKIIGYMGAGIFGGYSWGRIGKDAPSSEDNQ
jgi:hypothetical protein